MKKATTPLADQLRPQKLSEVVGQRHLLAKNQFLHQLIQAGHPTSMILWGPPGSGKTTIARIISNSGNFKYHEISAVTTVAWLKLDL